jgi:uncharacterized cupredoxin-like copper-binding protein
MLRQLVLALVFCAFAHPALAQGRGGHEGKDMAGHAGHEGQETAFGRQGDRKKVTRTINVDMSDRMRFEPAQLTVKQGETIRFRVKNSGKAMHEMVLGTMKDLKAHADLMRKHPGMEHHEAYMIHVAPGKTGAMLWQFTNPGEFHYGCLIPGHFEAGMVGTIQVAP